MQKNNNVLLMLSAEEKENAQTFIKRRLKTLDTDHLNELTTLSQLAKQFVRRWHLEKGQYSRSPSRSSKLMVKLHELAMADMQNLIKELDQTSYELNNKAQQANKGSSDSSDSSESDIDDQVDELMVTCDEEELQHASEFIKDKVENLRTPELKTFRDSFQEIITWWESERGQIESLHMDQVGNVNTASGRLAIREQRARYQESVFNPLKTFFREVNTSYQRAAKEASDKARMLANQAKAAG